MKDILQQEKVPEYIVDPNKFVGITAMLANLCKDIGDKLETLYPGWIWAVCPFEHGGIIKIFSLHCSGEFGYTMKVADIQDDPSRRLAIEAGGEILERYGLPRGPYENAKEMLRHKPRDIRGNLIPDITDKDGRTRKQQRDRDLTMAIREGHAQMYVKDVVRENGEVHRELHMRIGGDDDA